MAKKLTTKLKEVNERDARHSIIEDLFYDFSSSKKQVYWVNFVRGIFFGMGTIIGGTLLVALILWLLSWLVDVPGGFGDFVEYIINTVRQRTP